MELTTAVKYGIPVKHVLLDNHSLGKIGKEQRATRPWPASSQRTARRCCTSSRIRNCSDRFRCPSPQGALINE
jgi:hypothetical protein